MDLMSGKSVVKSVYSVISRFASNMIHRMPNTQVVKLEHSGKEWDRAVCDACCSLQNNQVIAVPTDTIYGIAGLAQSVEAVNRIYAIKQRDPMQPISICVGDVADIHRWGQVTISNSLLKELLPGPVTVVFQRTLDLNPDLNPSTTLVGIRVPDSGFVRDIARAAGGPLALTSANVSMQQSSLSIQEFTSLWHQLDYVFDGGILGRTPQSRLGSTVVDLSKPGTFTIIRSGSAYKETVDKLCHNGLYEEKKQ